MPINDVAPNELVFELSALHDYGYSQTFFFWYFSQDFGFAAIKSISFSF